MARDGAREEVELEVAGSADRSVVAASVADVAVAEANSGYSAVGAVAAAVEWAAHVESREARSPPGVPTSLQQIHKKAILTPRQK